MAMQNTDIVGVVDPLEASQGDRVVGSAMLKPCFSPFEPGICALATEEHPLQKSDDADLLLAPCILIVLIQRTHRASIRKLAFMELSNHCCAVQW